MAQWGSMLILPHHLGSASSSGQTISAEEGPMGEVGKLLPSKKGPGVEGEQAGVGGHGRDSET